MKVLITDNRSTPRIIYIDGVGYILPSKHPVPMDITLTAKTLLTKNEFMEVVEQEEEFHTKEAPNPEDILYSEEVVSEIREEEENPHIEEPKSEEHIEPKLCTVVGEPEEAQSDENISETESSSEIVEQEEPQEEQQEEKPDYASMLVKDLRAIMEDRGVDCKGWLKKDIVEYLETH
jgi:hypothetical protein